MRPDGYGYQFECDIFEEDCPRGSKCMPWADDGGNSWNATKCVPIARDPNAVGEPCTVEGSGVSGVDDCELHAICWDVDPRTNMGVCVAMCSGTADDPGCLDACETCVITSEGVLTLCLPSCDPLADDCGPGQVCYPIVDDFGCAPDASGDLGAAGDPCEYINACDAGLFCANPYAVPGCDGLAGCCALFCDTATVDPCPDAPAGVECVPWWTEPPPGGCVTPTLGACVLP
jgi:hypothetical protein